jgi:site-specific recombinase XerD
VRFRALQQFFNWLVDEEEIAVSPMAKLRPPKIPEQLTPVLDDAAIKALLKVCAGKGFADFRDTAIVRLFLDTGMRLDELATLRVEDVDLDYGNTAAVLGKGRRPRICPFGAKTAQALDRYLRQRARQKRADLPKLWLGVNGRGAMTDNGVAQVVRKRAQAGIQGLHPHMFRHTFAYEWRMAGCDDDSLMRLVGWRSRQMLHRYGASAADARAREAGPLAPHAGRPLLTTAPEALGVGAVSAGSCARPKGRVEPFPRSSRGPLPTRTCWDWQRLW